MGLKQTIRRILLEKMSDKIKLNYEFKCTDADEDGIFSDTCFGEIDTDEFAQFIGDMEDYEITYDEFINKFNISKKIKNILNGVEKKWLQFYDKSDEDGYVVVFDSNVHYIFSVN